MVFGVEGRAVVVVVRVRLGAELEEIWKVFEVLEWSGIKRRKNADFSEEEGRILSVLSGWGSARKKVRSLGNEGCALLVPVAAGFGWFLIYRFSGCN